MFYKTHVVYFFQSCPVIMKIAVIVTFCILVIVAEIETIICEGGIIQL